MANSTSKWTEYTAQPIGFASTWNKVKSSKTVEIQTEDRKLKDKDTQHVDLRDSSAQVDLGFDDKEMKVQPIEPPYPPSLYAFFAKVTDEVCRCLQENMDPFSVEVFKEHDEEEDEEALRKSSKAKLEFSLHNASVKANTELVGSCVAWNASGTQLAAAYTAETHDDWCSHRTPICSWNIRKLYNGFQESSSHSQVTLKGCITAMEFHPFYPSVLAVGTFSGSVGIVDFSLVDNPTQDSDHLSSRNSTIKDNASNDPSLLNIGKSTDHSMRSLGYFMCNPEHTLAITSIHWIKLSLAEISRMFSKNQSPSQYYIVSSGKDGFICLWSTNSTNSKIFLEKKFIAWADNIPADVPLSHGMRFSLKQLSLLSLQICYDDPLSYYVLAEGGLVFQGSLDGNIESYTAMMELEVLEGNPVLLDPCLQFVRSHHLLSQFLHASPFHRSFYILGSENGQISIQDALQPNRSKDFHVDVSSERPLNDLKWSGRAAMFAAVVDTTVQVFGDLMQKRNPVLKIRSGTGIAIKSIAFNRIDLEIAATIDFNGEVRIWSLPKKLASTSVNELDQFIQQLT